MKSISSEKILQVADLLYEKLYKCDLCPNMCLVNRLKGEKGVCKTGDKPIISSYGPHFGEERPLVGLYGSGTVFFTHCNMKCVYCQNYEISHLGEGYEITPELLAAIFLTLQQNKCHNINLVSPTHQIPFIVKAIYLAMNEGLNIPIVYNTGGYDFVWTLKMLEGIIDIYMPDFKYWDAGIALKLSGVRDYPLHAQNAIKEMHRQVGDLTLDKYGRAKRGLLVRHLVLPNNQSQSREVLEFLANEVSKNTYINIMDQYRPCYNANKYSEISRRITHEEYESVVNYAKELGFSVFDH